MVKRTFLMLALGAWLVVPAPARAEVNIGIHIETPTPPPPLVVASPPPVVVVPGSPVYYVPAASFNLFVYRGHYYSFHNGAWFRAKTHNGPWTVVAAERVPKHVRAVPATYYKIPPGHAKKLAREEHEREHGHGHGPKGKDRHDD